MIDTFNIPNNDLKTQVFFNEPISGSEWQVWNKPSNTKFISIFMLGGGAGGSGGIATAGTTRFGGAGGGSSSLTMALFPSFMLPDTLFIQVGKGGRGGLGTPSGSSSNPSPGGVGSLSYVSILPNTITTNLVLVSGNAVATGGSNQTAGIGGAVFTNSQAIFSNGGIINSVAGVSGGVSFTNAAGASINISNIPVSGGAGGGAATSTANFSGGSINEFSFLPRILGGISTGSTINGNDGYNNKILQNNISNRNILLFTGGAGGAGFYTGTGGKGGNGSYGSGGGGGGAGFNTSPFSGGTGGDGGDGIVIITSW
jgi:hypothetical protein